MPPKIEQTTPTTNNKNEKSSPSILVVPSTVRSAEAVETEIAAHVTIPEEGGWGWVVMVTSFTSIFIIDGIIFTFGSLYADVRDDIGVTESLITLVNSVSVAVYFTAGPIASAIINRFGFRECTMTGSIITFIAMLSSAFAPNYAMVFLFYGVMFGVGASFVAISSNLVVGFYFEKLRSIVMTFAGSGASAGIMILFYVNSYMTQKAGWRVTTLFHAGLCGSIYFLGMTYRPLVSLVVTKTTDEEDIQTVTYLPNLSKQDTSHRTNKDETVPTKTERMFQVPSNPRFPTAAKVLEEGVVNAGAQQQQAGPSTPSAMKLKIVAHSPAGTHHRQIKSLQSILSTTNQNQADKNVPMAVTLQIKTPKKRNLCARFCNWEKNIPESRPMYRDDAFYGGKVEDLEVYKKSVLEIASGSRTGLEYPMAVTRTATAIDIGEKKGIMTTAFKRILVTMIDPTLFKRVSFILLCVSAFCTYAGVLVPYVFLAERNKLEGIETEHCTMLLSVIGLTNLIGRIILGILACKIDPLILYYTACLISGLATMAFNFSFKVYYQYLLGSIFGFFIASLVSLRSLVLVKLYGLDMLTNATGLMVVFHGLGSLISTPLGSLLRKLFGFSGTFYLAGTFIATSGLVLIPVKYLAEKENKVAQKTVINNKNDEANKTTKPYDRKESLKEPAEQKKVLENEIDEANKTKPHDRKEPAKAAALTDLVDRIGA